ncbi:hypothetical protein V3C99_003090 [Haemonchus contortus]|uniref:N-acetylglucosamine-6-phosphate deacetylase n=1 Tax=Haemonchus contortus TaxID=6289 RepID=A0A7I4Y874_HAECO
MERVRYDSEALRDDLSGKLVQFINAKVLRSGQLIWDHVWVRDGKIIDAATVFYTERRRADIQVDCEGLILSPGFIDIQINGGFGMDFSSMPSTDEEYECGVATVSRCLLSHGVTSYLPTVITSPPEVYARVLPLLARRDGSSEGAGVLGVHIEGPFISPEKKGCHPKEFVRTFDDDPIASIRKVFGNVDNAAIVTLAPELKGSDEAIRYLTDKGIVVSLGHSSAKLKDAENGVKSGARCITHLFNAMHAYHHRDPCLIGLLASKKLSDREIYYGIISDGIHTHDSALRIAYRTNPEGMILVTDAIAALGMGEGRHKLGDVTVNVVGLRAVADGTNTTAGSVASMPQCIKHLIKAAGCPLQEALVCATEKPATLLGIRDRKGVIAVGADADMVLISDNADVQATYVAGKLVYANTTEIL